MSDTIMKILLADDHELVRRGLKELLKQHFPGAVVAEAENTRRAMELLDTDQWNAVLIDINMPGRDGLDLLEDIKRVHPRLPVLVVSGYPEEEYAVRVLRMGASGYVSKQCAADILVTAVKKVAAGGRHVSPAVAERLALAASGDGVEAPHQSLSHRELQVLQRVASGRSIKEIAAELSLSEKTIATYRSRISEKLALSSNVELTRYALHQGLVD
jgi:two-component system, NarL family, invasion response regulator UvrY